MARGRSVEVYLKPGIEEDDLIHEVWREAALTGRPQDLFRRILLTGIRDLYESGDLPRSPAAAVERSGLLMPRVPPRRPRGRPRKHPLPAQPLQQATRSAAPVLQAPAAASVVAPPSVPSSGDDPRSRGGVQGLPAPVPPPVPREETQDTQGGRTHPQPTMQPAAPAPAPPGNPRPKLGRLM